MTKKVKASLERACVEVRALRAEEGRKVAGGKLVVEEKGVICL